MEICFRPTVAGVFISRPNRFVAIVKVGSIVSTAHVATSGRLTELLVPGADVLLERCGANTRKTAFNLRAVAHGGFWVSIDSQLPNRLLEKAFKERALQPFNHCSYVRREPAYGGGRFDFLLHRDGEPVYVEVKSVTLVDRGVALFPDAPTDRGRRHLLHLGELAAEKIRAAIIFVVQREDAACFAANSVTDLPFAKALNEAVRAGVDVLAYSCLVSTKRLVLAERLPVLV